MRNCPSPRRTYSEPLYMSRSSGPARWTAEDADVDDDAAVGVVVRIEDQGLQGVRRGRLGSGHALDDRLEELVDSRPVAPRYEEGALGSRPRSRSIWRRTSSGSAEGMSILLMTGIISRSCSRAMYMFERVWASTPWVASMRGGLPRRRRWRARPRRRNRRARAYRRG